MSTNKVCDHLSDNYAFVLCDALFTKPTGVAFEWPMSELELGGTFRLDISPQLKSQWSHLAFMGRAVKLTTTKQCIIGHQLFGLICTRLHLRR